MQLNDEQGASEDWNFSPRRFREMAWYSEADAPPGVPVIDLAALCGGVVTSQRRRNLDMLREAVTTSGFLYVKNHGISEGVLEAIANETRSFFGQPEPFKQAFDRRDQVRGYTGYRVESTARFFGTSCGKDLCMKYTMGPELTIEEVRQRTLSETDRRSNAYSQNVFPDNSFRTAWTSYYEQVHRASCLLLEQLSDALELTGECQQVWQTMLIERSCGELRFLQYPDVPAAACAGQGDNVEDRMAAHFDMDVITLLHQTPCDNGFVSLEAKHDNRFYKVPAIRGTLVVNLGEIIRLLTGGRVRATVHRVVRPPLDFQRGSARDVTVFFQAPPLNAQLHAISFGDDVGHDTIFDDFYRIAGPDGVVSFSSLRARLFEEFMHQTRLTDEAHERDAHLFMSPL